MSFIEDTLEDLNLFRSQPNSITKKCNVVATGMSRFKGNEQFVKGVKDFIAQLTTFKSMPKLELNDSLSKAADTQLASFIQNPTKYNRFQDKAQLISKIPPQYETQNPNLIADEGADTPQDVLTKILFNTKDINQFGRKALVNPEYTQIGVAQGEVDGENYVIFIFANAFVKEEEEEPEEEVELPEGDLSDLKKAFDLFDYDKTGKIRIGLTIDCMKKMKFDQSDPVLFEILQGLSGNEVVSWPKFATHVNMRMTDRKTDKGLRTIFDLFVDNVEQDTISFETFKKIIKEIGVNISDDEARKILENTTERGNEITFDDFCIFMKEYDK